MRHPTPPVGGVSESAGDERGRSLSGRETAPLPSGVLVGRYVVQRTIGRGGMGIVYGAVDPKLGRRVALKLVRNDGTPQMQFCERLQREALALARLCHPNIVVIFDIGSTEYGTFVAMEYIHGLNLRQWLRLTPRSVAEVLDVFAQAAEGMTAAHEAGLVHRDFKPSNVMVTGDGRVKVLDFGLARGKRSEDPWLANTNEALLAQRMTRADIVVGTTGYMPPEQLLGEEVTPKSDQFAFCVALFEALHGARPFAGKTPVEQARTYANAKRTDVKQRRDVPPPVRAAIERGMSLDPRDRFDSMRDLLEALRAKPTPAWSRKSRVALGLALLVATAAASSAATSWLRPPTSDAAACTSKIPAP